MFYYTKWPTVQGINKDFIGFVRDNFVAVGIDGVAPGSAPEWAVFGEAAKKSYNGFAVCTAAGKYVGNADNLRRCIEDYKNLPKADRVPGTLIEAAEGKIPTPPPGGLVLNAYCTYLDRDANGDHSRAKWMLNDIYPTTMAGKTEPATTGNDMVWLTEAEWRAMAPSEPKKGQSVAVPPSVRKRILGLHACDFHPVSGGHRPGAPRAGDLVLTVEGVSSNAVDLRLDGFAETGKEFDPAAPAEGCSMRFLGYLSYDLSRKRFVRFDAVGVGECWGKRTNAARSGKNDAPLQRWPLGVAFELVTGDRPVDRTPPKCVAPYVACDYFGMGKPR